MYWYLVVRVFNSADLDILLNQCVLCQGFRFYLLLNYFFLCREFSNFRSIAIFPSLLISIRTIGIYEQSGVRCAGGRDKPTPAPRISRYRRELRGRTGAKSLSLPDTFTPITRFYNHDKMKNTSHKKRNKLSHSNMTLKFNWIR